MKTGAQFVEEIDPATDCLVGIAVVSDAQADLYKERGYPFEVFDDAQYAAWRNGGVAEAPPAPSSDPLTPAGSAPVTPDSVRARASAAPGVKAAGDADPMAGAPTPPAPKG